MTEISELQEKFREKDSDFTFFDHQVTALMKWQGEQNGIEPAEPLDKMLVFYPTGKGKTETMLSMMALRDVKMVLVLAPPSTHARWRQVGHTLGIQVDAIAHAKFRMDDFKVYRTTPIIVDEFHLLGGHTGKGWKKLDRLARGTHAPLVLGSATPNYNDAERVYCIAHVCDPQGNAGGYMQWLYEHCLTEANPYGTTPLVTGFRKFKDSAEFLASLPYTVYLPDEAPDILSDLEVGKVFDPDTQVSHIPYEFEELNLDRTKVRLVASIMEKRHRKRFMQIIDVNTGKMHEDVGELLAYVTGQALTPALIFCAHSEIAKLVRDELVSYDISVGYVDGDTTAKRKDEELDTFRAGHRDVLIGTASMATGTDGIDKMCDLLVILDDTDDDSLRRQLIGRILPRGASVNYAGKHAYRFVYPD